MGKTVTVMISALLLASCMATTQHKHPPVALPLFFEASPSTDIDKSKLQSSCPNFSGVYKSSILPSETTYVIQTGCEKLYISAESPASTQRNTYHLDGNSITIRKYLMHSVPFRVQFINGKLHFEGRGDDYTSYETWELTEGNGISEVTYAKRDNGEVYNHSERSYYQVGNK